MTTPPTCTKEGVKTIKCTGCDETRTETVEATGHTWDAGTETTAPTCTEKGVKTFKCTVCDETKTEDIPVSHKSDEGKVIEEPGYGKKGKKAYTCTVCSEVLRTEDIDALDAKETIIKFVEGHELSKTYDGKAVEVDKSWFVRETGDGTETIPADDITFEFEKYVRGTYEATTEAVNATYYKLIVKTAATDEWKAGSAEFKFEIKKINLGDIILSKVYDGKNTLEKTAWSGTDVLESEKAYLKYIVYMDSADVDSEFDGDAFMLGDTKTYNYCFSDITVEIKKKVVDSIVLKMDYEVIAKDADGYVKKVFSDIERYPGLTVTVYPYNNVIDGEFVPRKPYTSSTYYIYTSENDTEVKNAIDNRSIASDAFLAYADLGKNYEFPAASADGISLGLLTISTKAITGTVSASKQYDKDKTIRVTDLSGLEGIYDEDRNNLELVITMNSEYLGAAPSSWELHYHPNGNTSCTSETGDECPTVRYKLGSDAQVTASIAKKQLTLPDVIYSVADLRISGSGGPVKSERSFYVGQSNGTVDNDTFIVTYSGTASDSVWTNGGDTDIYSGNVKIAAEYNTNYKMTGGPYKLVLCSGAATPLTLGTENPAVESGKYKIYSIELVKDKRYRIVLASDASKNEKIGVVSESGIHPVISNVKTGVRISYNFKAPESGTHYIVVAYSDDTSHTYKVTVSEIT